MPNHLCRCQNCRSERGETQLMSSQKDVDECSFGWQDRQARERNEKKKADRSAKIEELIRKVMVDQSVYYDTPEEDDALCSNCHKSLVRDGLPYDYCFNPDCCAFQLRELLKNG